MPGAYLLCTYQYNSQVIARESAFTRDELDILLKAAADHAMEVVPLVQTFGHLGQLTTAQMRLDKNQ